MEVFGYVLFLFTMFVFWTNVQGAVSYTNCTKLTSCSCLTDTGLVVDLSPLTDSSGKAKFSDVKAKSGDDFSWNPCKDFTEKAGTATCTNVAACQIQLSTPPLLFGLGNQNSASFNINGKKNLQVSYSSKSDPKFTRTAIVELVCDESQEGTLTAEGESPPTSGKYYMTLTSKYACAKSQEPSNSSNGLTVGSILLIIVLVLVIVYVVVGVSINKYGRHATGKEVVPNYTFWTALPGLIKDGVLFAFSGCKNGSGTTYDNI
ncbi:hypothetical protein SNE40_022577 [Patella caerulea]|uniref:Autophagy-related protein 27 n=1 Tax=Patella caerulea TaxID=87958 RepID=A0AAN8GFV3_PATCE